MANVHATLTSLFTDIADAIRDKTGSTTEIVADDFPDVIDTLPHTFFEFSCTIETDLQPEGYYELSPLESWYVNVTYDDTFSEINSADSFKLNPNSNTTGLLFVVLDSQGYQTSTFGLVAIGDQDAGIPIFINGSTSAFYLQQSMRCLGICYIGFD